MEEIQNNDEIINENTCSKCKYFEARTKFCRRFPPTALITMEKNKGYYTSTFPKIQMPELDYCFEFKEKED